ncbi:hypothetical protein [Aeropyrum camini]|uniref:hypothetical protein n=1 Tax=Aeropyrum camini TaxID=229980 RepID=UPI0012E22A2B|nr:hypothetical protein [Aeropyrum camini]
MAGEGSVVVDAIASIASTLEQLLRSRGYNVEELAAGRVYDVETRFPPSTP